MGLLTVGNAPASHLSTFDASDCRPQSARITTARASPRHRTPDAERAPITSPSPYPRTTKVDRPPTPKRGVAQAARCHVSLPHASTA